MEDNNGNEITRNEIPDSVMDEFVQVLMPELIRFYQSEENRRAYEEWKNATAETITVS
ncbi:MAG: hypothetical protein IKD72_08640 [Clostridia bacterium]|nr:hypothetical protein [Clostridia bacterium]